MKKRLVVGLTAGIFLLIIISAWIVNTQFITFQAKIVELEKQNLELQNQIITLQDQTQLRKNRIIQLLEQNSEKYQSSTQIAEYQWIGGFNPYVGLTLAYTVNVTISNHGATDAHSLSISVKLINIYDGNQIGISGGTNVGTLLPGEIREIKTMTFANLNESLRDAACVITIKQSNIVIDEWIRYIGT